MFKSRILSVAILYPSLFALSIDVTLLAQERAVNLYMHGFGERTHVNWAPDLGLTDNNPNTNEALLFQRMVPTPEFGAATAAFHGFDGAAPANITQLKWRRRHPPIGDNCTGPAPVDATPSPRWSFRIRLADGSTLERIIGCETGAYSGGTMVEDPNDPTAGWSTHTANPDFADLPAGAILIALTIIYDDGDDTTAGFVILDNIEITGTTNQAAFCAPCTWTSAADNGTN